MDGGSRIKQKIKLEDRVEKEKIVTFHIYVKDLIEASVRYLE